MYIAAFLLVLISIVSPLSAGEKGTIDESSLKYWSLKNVKITAQDSAKGIYCYTATVKGKREVIMILSDSSRFQVSNHYQPVLLSRLPLHVVNADIGMPLAPNSLYYVYKGRKIGADEFGGSDKIHYGLLDFDTVYTSTTGNNYELKFCRCLSHSITAHRIGVYTCMTLSGDTIMLTIPEGRYSLSMRYHHYYAVVVIILKDQSIQKHLYELFDKTLYRGKHF